MLKSERGNTLILVLGFVMILGILMIPLLTMLNNGLLHSATDGTTETAYIQAESAAVVYKRLYAEAQANGTEMTEADARQLANGIASIGLYDRLEVDMTPPSGMPESIAFSSWSGEGQQERGQTVELQFNYSEQNGGGSVAPVADVFYRKHAVITDKRNYDYLFTYCGPERPSVEFIGKNYDKAKFETEFNEYMARYTGAAFDERFNRRPMPLTPLAVPGVVKTIPNVKTKTTPYTYKAGGGPGVKYDGDVELTQIDNNSPYPISAMTTPGYEGIAIQAAGNVSIASWNSGAAINGKLIVGGSLLAPGSTSLTITGDTSVRENMTIGQMGVLTVKGDLYVNGNASFSGTDQLIVEGDMFIRGNFTSAQMGTFTVKGNLIVNGNMAFTGSVNTLAVGGDLIVGGDFSVAGDIQDKLSVKGTLSSGKNMKFGTANLISAGKWTASDQIDGNDRNSIIAGAQFSYGRIDKLRATGDFSSMTYISNNDMSKVTLGGSFLSGGNVSLPSKVADWTIPGSISVGGSLAVASTARLIIGDSIYAAGEIKLDKVETNFLVGGSILSPINITFVNTLQVTDIRGDIISSGGTIQFMKPVDSLTVGGSIAAGSNIAFKVTVNKMTISHDLISSGNITFENVVAGPLTTGGMTAALKVIDFQNSLGNTITLGGFYAGETMMVKHTEEANSFCINYNPPASQTIAPSKQLNLTTAWRSRSYWRH